MDENHLKTLIQLGLSANQGKLYLNLLALGRSTGRALAKETLFARQEIYRLIHELQNIGLIEKIICNPTEFQAVPIKAGISILLNKKTRELEQVKQRGKNLIQDLSSINTTASSDKKDYSFLLIPPKKLANETRERMIENSKEKIDLITTSKRFSQGISHFHESYVSRLKKNVVAKILVIGTKDKMLSNINEIKKLEAFSNFALRFTKEKKTSLLIVDDKEAIITLSPQLDLGSSPVFWTDHPELIALCRFYFDTNWSKKGRAQKLQSSHS